MVTKITDVDSRRPILSKRIGLVNFAFINTSPGRLATAAKKSQAGKTEKTERGRLWNSRSQRTDLCSAKHRVIHTNLVDRSIEAISGRISSITAMTADDHRKGMPRHRATSTTRSLYSVHEDHLVVPIKLKRKVGPFTSRHDARVTKIITP
jgi:hypothetical protein